MANEKEGSRDKKKNHGPRCSYTKCARCGTRTKYDSGTTTKWNHFCPRCTEKFWSNPGDPKTTQRKTHGLPTAE